MENLCSAIESIALNHKGVLWIAGDFNLPDIHWPTLSIRGSYNTRSINERFLRMISHTGLEQAVDFPKRGDTCLDLFLTNRPSLIKKIYPGPGIGLSDHDTVHIESDLKAARRKPTKRKINLWQKANMDEVRNAASQFNNSFLTTFTTESPVEDMWQLTKLTLHTIIETSVPSKMTSVNFSQPWCNTAIKRLSRQQGEENQISKRLGPPTPPETRNEPRSRQCVPGIHDKHCLP